MRDGLKLRANVFIIVGDQETGEEKVIETHNMVVDAGRNLVRDLLRGTVGTPVYYIAFGSSSAAPSSGQTTLSNELVRYAFSIPADAITGQLTFHYYMSSASGPNGSNICEVGLFTAASNGTMYARATFSAVAKTTGIYLKITWVLGFNDDGV